jgi:hypothetical protein
MSRNKPTLLQLLRNPMMVNGVAEALKMVNDAANEIERLQYLVEFQKDLLKKKFDKDK